MKISNSLSLVLLYSTVTVSLPSQSEKRQLMDSLVSYFAGKPQMPVYKKNLEPEMDPKATRELLVWGPYKLLSSKGPHPAGGMGLKLDANSDSLSGLLGGTCQECMILQANMETSDKMGNKNGINEGVYTHHFVTSDIGRAQLPNPVTTKCNGFSLESLMGGGKGGMGGMMGSPKSPSFNAGGHQHTRRQSPKPKTTSPSSGFSLSSLQPSVSIFIGKGNEAGAAIFAAPNSTVKSGFYLSKSDKIYMTAELVNYKPMDRDIYIMMDYEYIPSSSGSKPAGYMDVGMGSISVDGCNMASSLKPPKDKAIQYKSPDWTVTHNGYLVNIKPHLHDGALDIKVYLNNKLVCTSNAVYGGDVAITGTAGSNQKWETITSYTPCSDPVKIKKGDKLTMTSDYDVPKHKLRPDAHSAGMGMGGGEGAEGMALANFMFAMSLDQSDKF